METVSDENVKHVIELKIRCFFCFVNKFQSNWIKEGSKFKNPIGKEKLISFV